MVVAMTGAAPTTRGLRIKAVVDDRSHEKGRAVSDDVMKALSEDRQLPRGLERHTDPGAHDSDPEMFNSSGSQARSFIGDR